MEQRELRRDLTVRIGRRRQELHLKVVHSGQLENLDCVCELSAWKFSKSRALGCGCRSRKHGQPKLGSGPCCRYDFRPRRLGRAAWRQARHLWQAGVTADDKFDGGEV